VCVTFLREKKRVKKASGMSASTDDWEQVERSRVRSASREQWMQEGVEEDEQETEPEAPERRTEPTTQGSADAGGRCDVGGVTCDERCLVESMLHPIGRYKWRFVGRALG